LNIYSGPKNTFSIYHIDVKTNSMVFTKSTQNS